MSTEQINLSLKDVEKYYKAGTLDKFLKKVLADKYGPHHTEKAAEQALTKAKELLSLPPEHRPPWVARVGLFVEPPTPAKVGSVTWLPEAVTA